MADRVSVLKQRKKMKGRVASYLFLDACDKMIIINQQSMGAYKWASCGPFTERRSIHTRQYVVASLGAQCIEDNRVQ